MPAKEGVVSFECRGWSSQPWVGSSIKVLLIVVLYCNFRSLAFIGFLNKAAKILIFSYPPKCSQVLTPDPRKRAEWDMSSRPTFCFSHLHPAGRLRLTRCVHRNTRTAFLNVQGFVVRWLMVFLCHMAHAVGRAVTLRWLRESPNLAATQFGLKQSACQSNQQRALSAHAPAHQIAPSTPLMSHCHQAGSPKP